MLGAIALDVAIGEPPARWHPVVGMGALLERGRRLLAHGSPPRLLLSGAVLVIGVAALVGLGAWLISLGTRHLGVAGVLVEALLLKTLLAVRDLARAASHVARDLAAGQLEFARVTVGRDLVSRPTAALDEIQVASAAIESVAENLTDSVLAPLLFYVLFGLAGAAAYRAINTADAMFGYREGVLEYFGKTAARLDDVMNVAPARLAGLGLVGAALLGREDWRRAAATMWAEHGKTASPNAGWTMAAMAGALGVTLEKPAHYRLGAGPAPKATDIGRSVRLMRIAVALAALAAAGAGAWLGR